MNILVSQALLNDALNDGSISLATYDDMMWDMEIENYYQNEYNQQEALSEIDYWDGDASWNE